MHVVNSFSQSHPFTQTPIPLIPKKSSFKSSICGKLIFSIIKPNNPQFKSPMGKRRDTSNSSTAVNTVFRWVKDQSWKVQASLAASIAISTIFMIHYFLDSDYFYVFSQVSYMIGNMVLVYKLIKHKNCSGISLRSQEVMAAFVAARLICILTDNLTIELHSVIDSLSLISTGWVIYMIRFKLQSSYAKELDTMPIHYVLVPCFVLALLINPSSEDMTWLTTLMCVAWAFATYTESVSVLPQLRLIQNAKVVEPYTAHYVFALGVSRFFGFCHWALMIYETDGKSLLMLGTGWFLWLVMHFLAEIVQTFILADFCYYYIQSVMRGQRMMLPMPV